MFKNDARTEMFKFAWPGGKSSDGEEQEQNNMKAPWSNVRRNTITMGNNPPPKTCANNSAPSARSRSIDHDVHDHHHHPYEEEGDDPNLCDPLQYRLQHRKQYIEEIQNRRNSRNSRRNRSLSRSSSSRGSKKERDPFDVWGSLTSEDTTRSSQHQRKLKNEPERSNHVDDVGWGSGTPSSSRQFRRRSSKDLSISEHEDENDDSGLYVDFGGGTPQDMSHERRVQSSCALKTMDENEPAYSTPYHQPNTSSRHTFSAGSNLEQDLLQVGFPQRDSYDEEDAGLDLGFPQQRHPQHEELDLGFPQRNHIASSHSTFSSVSADQMNDFDICGYGTDRSEGRASHTDLANILSSLERESESMGSAELLVLTATDSPARNATVALSFCSSTLSSPTGKAMSALAESASEPPTLPLSPPDEGSADLPCPTSGTVPQHKEELRPEEQYLCEQQGQQFEQPPCEESSSPRQPPRQERESPPPIIPPDRPSTPKTSEVEEDDPRLAQLKQQTAEELRSELYSMQSQSKINLEKSWADTEKMRVEISELDDKLENLSEELSVAKAAIFSGGRQHNRTSSILDGVLNNDMMSDLLNFRKNLMCGGVKKSVGPSLSKPRNSMRRTGSVKSLANLCLEETEQDLDASWGNRSTVTSYVDRTMIGRRQSLSGGSLHQEKNNTRGKLEALFGDSLTPENVAAVKASSSQASGRGSFRRNSFIRSLSGGIGGRASSGRSVDSHISLISALGVGIDESHYDDDSSDATRQKSKEFNEEIYEALLAQPEAYPTPNDSYGRNESTHSIYSEDSKDAISGVFYPPPSSTHSSSDSIAKSGVFYPPPADECDDEDEEDEATYYGGQTNTGGGQSVCPSICPSIAHTVATMSQIDDFDFDPLHENAAVASVPTKEPAPRRRTSRINRTGESKRGGGFVRRPSFMSLFDPNDNQDTDEDSAMSPTPPPPRRQRKTKKSSAILSALILQKERDVKKLAETIKSQEEKIVSCEAEIVGAGIQNRESSNMQMEEEAILQAKVKELEEFESEIESRLDNAEDHEQIAKEEELALLEELAVINSDYQARESEIKLENELDKFKEQYNTTQENAIDQLSSLLKEFDSIGIPSLRGDLEDDIAGNIIARFDKLTDEEEELVCIISDVDRRTCCQASFQEIQKNIETAMFWKNQLGVLESDLRGSLGTIVMLMKKENGDEMTSTTESSTASERISLERMFVEAMLSQLESVEQKQGRLVLDALSGSLEFLSYWDEWLVPDYFAPSNDTPSSTSTSSGGNLDAVVSSILKAKTELEEAKLGIFNEQAEFQAKMKRSGIRLCYNTKSAPELGHNDSDQQLTANPSDSLDRQSSSECAASDGIGVLNNQISDQISTANDLLSRRESMMEKYSSFFRSVRPQAREAAPQANTSFLEDILEEDDPDQLKELEDEICEETRILSQQEDVLNGYTSQLESMQRQAQEDSENHMQLTNEIQMKIKHILTKLAEEESLVEYLEGLLQEKRGIVVDLEAQLQTPAHDYGD